MAQAYFHFHDELNDFLPRRKRHTVITHWFDWRASIKDMIESLGVPHCEIELILVNTVSVDWRYLVEADDDIQVYPYFDGIASPGKVRLRDPLVGRPSFVLDTHLGRLASYLRMLGFDTLYRNDYSDDELARISHDEKRILLTRDVGLLKRSVVTYGYFVRNTDPRKHLVEVMERFKLGKLVQPFRYCLKCNGLLIPVQKESVLDRLLPDTARYYDEFHLCQGCGQVYWKGSHYRRMQDFIAQVLG